MIRFLDFVLLLLSQFAGGPGPIENNLVRFGLPAAFWGVLLGVAWSRQRRQELPREKLLIWGFGLGLARELFMFSHIASKVLSGIGRDHHAGQCISEPLEHAIAMAAIVMVAGSFLRYILDDDRLTRWYLRIGLAATLISYLITFWWWPIFSAANPEVKFHQTWWALLFHIVASLLLAAAIAFLSRKRGWLRNVVTLALTFYLLGELIIVLNFTTDKAFRHIFCPIGNTFHILVAPILGYVYLREQSIEKEQAEAALKTYRDHLEDLVAARTEALTQANAQLQREIVERKQAEDAVAELSRRNELILTSAGEGIFGVDLHGNHTFVNPAAAQMLGYAPEALIGKPSHATWHHSRPDGSPYPEAACPLHNGYKTGAVHYGDDQVFWRKDGSNFPVQYTSTPVIEQDELKGAVVVFRDITERKVFEAEITQRNAELSAQNAIADTSSRSLDLNTILTTALDQVIAVLGMDAGCLYLMDTDTGVLSLRTQRWGKASNVDAGPLRQYEEAFYKDISSQAIARLLPIIVDVSEHPPERQSAAGEEGAVQALVSIPLIAKGRPLGALTLSTGQSRAELPQRLELLSSIGKQIGVAVENARLYQQTENWGEGLALLHQASIFLNSTLEPVEIYKRVTELATKLLSCHAANIFMWDLEAMEAVSVSQIGFKEPNADMLRMQHDASPLLQELFDSCLAIVIEDVRSDARVPPSWHEVLNVHALLCLPVCISGEAVGFLLVMDLQEARHWRSDEVILAESFVNRAAVALENAHLHKQVEWAAALEERQRIAAEMHDGLAQTLSYMGFRVDELAESLTVGRFEGILDECHNLRRAIDQASREVRLSIASLQESPQAPQSLQAVLRQVIEDVDREGSLPIDLVIETPAPFFLPPGHQEQVSRVVQEAILNAIRHAQAQHITVTLSLSEQEVQVTIEDDGCGFDPHAPVVDGGKHFGLSIMHARAARIGGTIRVDSQVDQGTCLTLTWPANTGVVAAHRPKSLIALAQSSQSQVVSGSKERVP